MYVETPSAGRVSHSGAGQRATLIMGHQSNLLRAHQDCVRAVACLDAPFRGGLITADRAGMIKVWRVEGLAESTGNLYG